MILTGPEIHAAFMRGDIEIDPFVPEHLGPNSLDLRLSDELLVYDTTGIDHLGTIDMRRPTPTVRVEIPAGGYTLWPGRLYLGCTMERLGSGSYVACIEGRSSVGRLGLSIHATAGVGDLGFFGQWTLEMSVVEPVRVYPHVRIAQALFFVPRGDHGPGYQGKYRNQTGPRASEIWRDFR